MKRGIHPPTSSSSRSKKCVPFFGGFFCLENMTWFVLTLLVVSVVYLYYTLFYKPQQQQQQQKQNSNNGAIGNLPIQIVLPPQSSSSSLSDPYVPPLKTIDIRGQPSGPMYGTGPMIPVNISTSSANAPYQQIGILTKTVQSNRIDGGEPTILPLMGRSLMNGRDKWQYYTVSNTNNSVRLPVSVKGKSCTNEYGCDSIYNGDTIYVEGYDDVFKATIYENSTLRYIPM